MMTLAQAHGWLPGSRLIGDGATALARVHTDTRSLQSGDLFVALKGERHDAHDFLMQARSAGAAAALAEHGLVGTGWAGLQVEDSRLALGALSAAWRRGFDGPLIAVTGSNGKTTVTQMVASILRAWQGDGALATAGNFNNDIGLPLTLLRLRPGQHRVAVVELGMNHPGEIARLAALAAPTVALVNNAQREHQEFMASVEAVARENGCVIDSLAADGVAVFPRRRPAHRAVALAGRQPARHDLRIRCVRSRRGAGRCRRRGHLVAGPLRAGAAHPGRQRIHAACTWPGCTTCATPWPRLRARWLPVARSMRWYAASNAFRAVAGRSQSRVIERGGQRVLLIDDSYNANPDSVRAAIDVLAGLPGPRWLLLGDMGEVGDQGPAFHHEVGAYARQRGIEALWTAGELCAQAAVGFGATDARSRHFEIGRCAAGRSARRGSGRDGARQGLALHEDGAGGRCAAGRRADRPRQRGPSCCLASPNGCRRCHPSSDSSGCSST